ncbi:MAG: NAD-dependent epimerase/dehydratase family protein [Thermoanaerobaculia bacterium]
MILVTGAGGFLGRHVVRRWVEANPERPLRALFHHSPERVPAGVEVMLGDLLDADLLRRALAGVETIVHLAAKNVDRDGSGFEQVNVEGTRNLCREAVAAGVRRFLYVSSVGVYGHGVHRDADESTPVRPDTPLSRSKAEAEKAVLERHRCGEWTGIVLRQRFVYGEGDEAVVPRLIRAARKYPVWIGGGKARLSLVLADDFAEVVRRLVDLPREAFAGPDDPVLHVTDGQPIRYREVITEICRVFGFPVPRLSLPFPLIYGPVRLRERLLGIDPEVATSALTSVRLKLVAQDDYFSNRKLSRLLPGFGFTSFRDGLARSLSFYAPFGSS